MITTFEIIKKLKIDTSDCGVNYKIYLLETDFTREVN